MGATFDLHTDPGAPVCSRAGCAQTALWRINWRNPRIHASDRVKVWAACDEHRPFLADYLRSRSFPVAVTGIDEDIDHLEDIDHRDDNDIAGTDTAANDAATNVAVRGDAATSDAATSDAARSDAIAVDGARVAAEEQSDTAESGRAR